jgi:hypothetical protein
MLKSTPDRARRKYALVSAPLSLIDQDDRLSTMLRIKHGVRTTFGDILWDEPLPPIYATREECIAAIESFITGFDHYEEEPLNHRWCAWNDNKMNEFHYWWITVAERPITHEDE